MATKTEIAKSGFHTTNEVHPSEMVTGGTLDDTVGIKDLRDAIPAHCFQPSLGWSFFYLGRDLTYSAFLVWAFFQISDLTSTGQFSFLYYPLLLVHGFLQGLVWTGLWIIAHECGHSAFSGSHLLNDTVGWVLHSWLLAPYFSWKSTHRRHHIYANNVEKDLNYVPPLRNEYAAKLGLKLEQLDELAEDAPIVLFLRIVLQQAIGWNWYIISNITSSPGALVKQGQSVWRHSHFDPWGSLFRSSEATSIILSDIGCAATLTTLWFMYKYLGSVEQVFWLYFVPWCWVNHWIVMITYLHHTHPSLPKYTAADWTFTHGATATMDRDFGFIGTHFFHHISSDHVVHHLFSKIPHYYAPEATKAIAPLLGNHYHGAGGFGWSELKLAFTKCQFVDNDESKDRDYFGIPKGDAKADGSKTALWYRGGASPNPEYRMRRGRETTSEKAAK